MGGVGDHVYAWSEGADEDAHHDGAACQPQLDGQLDAGDTDGDGTQEQTQRDTDENGHEVGLIQAFYGIAEYLLDVVDGRSFPDDRQAVAQLQHQFRGGKQLDTGTVNAGDVDAEGIAQAE